MKKAVLMRRLAILLALILAVTAWTGTAALAGEPQYQPITRQLITMVEHDDNLKQMLVESIALAKEKNPDPITNPAQTLEGYYDYIDWASLAMPWNILSDLPYTKLYEQIDQSIDYMYYLNDQPLPELEGKGYYNNSIQYVEPYRTWLVHFTKAWGEYLSMAVSWNNDYYQKALADDRFGLSKGWYESPDNWHSFNDFFSRYLVSPDVRPIASPDDASVVVAPADSKPQGVWAIDENSNIVQQGGVQIKSEYFNSIPNLLGPGCAYADAFAGGTLTHTFLDVNDYHRYHFPVSGTVKEVRIIPADDAAGGITQWDADLGKYVLLDETPGWQTIETRGCVILDTDKYGLVAVMPIGMSQVSSVNFENSVQVGAQVKKGDMLGTFLFGGSDIVMLFQKQVDFSLLATPDGDAGYLHLLMGEAYGKMAIK
ncbi:MAG TPA: phosphatidylserine decarboxylase [Candidatus Limiplasma sp.]|nr:phosphatidylserine decarboxylase [Candidatus Limiplasma sp.]